MLNDRRSLLDQVATGQLTPEAALRGLSPAAAQWLRVRITHLETGRQRVSLNVPMSWIEPALKLGGRFEPALAGLEWGALLSALRQGPQGQVLTVENLEDNERIEIYVE